MENKAKKGLLLALVIVLIVLGAASSVISFFDTAAASPVWFVLSIVTLLVYAVMIYYLIEDYKRPHGNLFRYCVSGYSWLFLVFCLLLAREFFSVVPLSVVLFAAAAVLSSYVAGRLNKLKSVTTVMSIVSALMLIGIIYTVADQQYTGLANDFGALFIDIQWFAIMATYLFRFKAHSEAGLKK